MVIVTTDRFADHLMPPGHPERVARAHVMQAVAARWAERGVPVVEPRPATRDELLRVHAPSYVDRIDRTAGQAMRLDPDTYTSRQTAEVAVLAAGASIVAVDRVLDRMGSSLNSTMANSSDESVIGKLSPDPFAMVLVRPPGHHAETGRAMGFCIYNNTAIAAAHALARGLTRIAIVDYDVHHGNGTQWTFYGDPRVLFMSTHQYPFYPGSGSARECGSAGGEGFTVNVPLAAGATDGDYLLVFDRIILPLLAAFGPQLLIVSAGFDAHMRDPLAQMRMSVDGFNQLALRLRDLATNAACPAVFIIEGGYHLKVLGACLDGLAGALAGASLAPLVASDHVLVPVSGGSPDAEPLTPDDLPLVEQPLVEVTDRGRAAVELVSAVQKRYWPGL